MIFTPELGGGLAGGGSLGGVSGTTPFAPNGGVSGTTPLRLESKSTFIATNLAYKQWLWLPCFRLHAGKKSNECDYDGKG
jgi:hypothetical protein